jgi:hypothetical protein
MSIDDSCRLITPFAGLFVFLKNVAKQENISEKERTIFEGEI